MCNAYYSIDLPEPNANDTNKSLFSFFNPYLQMKTLLGGDGGCCGGGKCSHNGGGDCGSGGCCNK